MTEDRMLKLVSFFLILSLALTSVSSSIAAPPPPEDVAFETIILPPEAQSASDGSTANARASALKAPRIRLVVGEFDPLLAPEPGGLPDSLRLSAYPGDGTGYYLLQFRGPIAASDIDALTVAGAETFDYIPDFTFIVKMNNATRAVIEGMKHVRWVGLYQPAYRLPTDLLTYTFDDMPVFDFSQSGDGRQTTDPRALWDDNPIEVIVTIFRGEELTPILAQVETLGGTILDQSQTKWKSKLKVSISPSRLTDLAAFPGVRWIEKAPEWKLANNEAADIMGVREVWDTHGLYGAGQTIAVCDSGLDQGSTSPGSLHNDFENGSGTSRVLTIHDVAGDGAPSDVNSGHGTHVAGSVLGNGDLSGATPGTHTYPNTAYVGMAPEASLVFQASEDNSSGGLLIPADLNTLFAQAASSGADLHTNSWGSSVAGMYTNSSEEVDEYVWDHKNFTILFAASNEGIDSNADGVIDLYSMGSPATAKNCIAVGATENDRPSGSTPTPGYDIAWGTGWPTDYPTDPINSDHLSDDPTGMAAFSSRGPTLDGRHKPDIVAPGTNIASTRSSLISGNGWGPIDANYMFMGGTSMATPLTAGAATLVRQYYTDEESITPSAALIKATLANGATDIAPGQYGTGATQEIPDDRPTNVAGWGRVNVENSIFPSSPRTMLYEDETTGLTTGGSDTFNYTVSSSAEPLHVTLAWSDYPGSPSAAGGLVNDLDLTITGPGGTYYPNNASQRGASQHLTYDDGGASGSYRWASGIRNAVRFTPTSYPATLQTGLFYVGSYSDDYPKTFNWYVYDGNGTTGPSSVLASGSTTIRRWGWHPVDLSGEGVTISSGDFFLAIELPDSDLMWFYDASSPIDERSWDYSSGSWSKWTTNDYMFNAILTSAGASTNQDRVNNLVGIDITSPPTGEYVVTVSGYNVPHGPQPYALVTSGAIGGGGNTAPTISGLPDQSLPVNTSLDNAIDLWNYASDAEDADADLTFSIDDVSAPDAGVSIDGSNRYIDINPITDWTGQADVTVRVTDSGGLYDTDIFRVTVTAAADKTWDGSTSSDWHTADNWTPSGVPTSGDDVLIPNVSNDPIISSSDAAVDSLTVNSGAVLDLTDRTLTVEGTLTNNGTLKQTQGVSGGATSNFLRITNLAGIETKYYGVDITPSGTAFTAFETNKAAETFAAQSLESSDLPMPAAPLADVELILDDGTQESNLVLRDPNTLTEFHAVLFNHFAATMVSGFPFTLERIDIHENTNNLQGEDIQLLVYTDADGGDPGNATLLYSEIVTVQTQLGWNVYTLTNPVVISNSADILVGFSTYYADGGVPWPFEDRYPYPMDTTDPQGRSYLAWMNETSDPVDPSDLSSFPNLRETGSLGSEFAANWLIRGYGSMGTLNTSPIISGLPDQTVPMNGSADDAIDLWTYASDTEDASDVMTYTISNSPTISAGVTIDSNRYIDINPTTGWAGVTDVEIQVQDTGGLTDTDTFQVTVSDAPDIDISPTSFEETLAVDKVFTATLTISNTGTAFLSFWFDTVSVSWLSVDPGGGGVASGGSQLVDVIFDATGQSLGDYNTNLIINSNDPDENPVTVPVVMHVAETSNTPPTISGLPDQAVPVNGSLHVPVDLWTYASDTEDANDVMTYTISNSPTISAGVNIDSNHYIEINPATDWIGVTDVEIQVQDTGGLTDTDTFQVTVGDVPNIKVIPTFLEETLDVDEVFTVTLTISNTGTVSLTFEIHEQPGAFTPTVVTLSTAGNTGHVSLEPALATGAPVVADRGRPSGETVVGTPAGLLVPKDIGTAWEVMTPLPSARVFNAVIAAGGYVYVIGGSSNVSGTMPTNTNLRYNTQTNTWDTMTPMPAALSSMDGIAINDKIYVPGSADTTDNNTYVYDIATDSWSTTAANGGYAAPAQYQVAAIGTDLYVLGGITGGASTTNVWILDTTTETWSAGVPMQNSRTSFSAAAINGNIYVAGGVAFPGFTPDMTAEMFDGASWSYIANVPDGGGAYTRWSYNADGHGEDGLWLAAGRRDAGWNVLNHAGYYDPDTNSWTDSPTIPTLSQGRVYMEGAVAADGYFYVIGGRNSASDVMYDTNERLLVGYPGDDVPWLSEDPISGTIAAGDSVAVDVVLDATGLALGDYTAKLLVESNDPDDDPVTVPVTMHVSDTSNTPPTISSLPDQEVVMNGSSDNAIDLWAYANDAEDIDANMTYTITNSPNPNAGVTIDSNRYIDINPAAGRTCVTDVEIQVQDTGGLTDTDTFQVTITDTVAINNVTVSVSGNQFCAGRTTGVERCFDITPAAALEATVRFYLSEAERNGLTLSDLLIFHYSGGSWTEEPGPYTSGGAGDAQYVQAQNIDDFSLFALDEEPDQGGTAYLPIVMKYYPPIPNTPTLNAISNSDGDGNYNVSWSAVDLADTYTLQEDDNLSFSSPTTRSSDSSTSWSASGKATGTYYYRVKAINNWEGQQLGSGWSNVQSVTVIPPPPPTKFYPSSDTTILQGLPGSNFGTMADMWAGYEHCSGSANGITRSLVKFNLSAIPSDAQITQAVLSLYLANSCDSGNRTHTVTTYRITSNWSGTSVTWNTSPSHAEAYGSSSVSSRTYKRYTFDITNLVRGWVNGSLPNHGLMLRGPESSGDSSARLGFATLNASGTTYDPYITITYAGMATAKDEKQTVEEILMPTACGPTVKDALGMFPGSSDYDVFGFVEQTVCSPD